MQNTTSRSITKSEKENGFSNNTLIIWRSTHASEMIHFEEVQKSDEIKIRKRDVNFINEYRKFADKYLKKIIL